MGQLYVIVVRANAWKVSDKTVGIFGVSECPLSANLLSVSLFAKGRQKQWGEKICVNS